MLGLSLLGVALAVAGLILGLFVGARTERAKTSKYSGQERTKVIDPKESDYYPYYGDPITDWRTIFAWRPIQTVDSGWVWLRFIFRRRIAKHNYLNGGSEYWFQYKVR